ncbi:MAG: cobalamin-binding protein [Deltaproteobacteria bacterium]|nr:cobalamin-binding protein [Deltaproteobacteria bacterium]
MFRRLVLTAIIFFSISGCAFAARFERIISLAPNVTEILYAMGLEDKIVAVTDFCDWPARVKEKPRIGGIINPSIEAILSMKPDIVIMTDEGNPQELRTRLEAVGINTYVVGAKRLGDLPGEIRALGRKLSVAGQADALAGDMEKEVEGLRKRDHKVAGEKALFIVWPEPLIVAGADTPIDDALKVLGLENVAGASTTGYPKYSVEEVILSSPSVIFIGKGHAGIEEFSKRLLAKLSGVPAVRNRKVYYISDSILRPGPRIVDGIKEMKGYLDE